MVILKEPNLMMIPRTLTMFRYNLIHIMAMLKVTIFCEMCMERKSLEPTNVIGRLLESLQHKTIENHIPDYRMQRFRLMQV
uniref:Uncharacterized protein n=1 Tax=Arundo donax TaxID=35708 RepID=A0A0A9FN62_ARUDO